MQGAEYRKALKALKLTQVGAAKLLGVNDRTSRRWVADEVPIPQAVAMLLSLMIKHKIKPEDMTGSGRKKKKRESARRDADSPV